MKTLVVLVLLSVLLTSCEKMEQQKAANELKEQREREQQNAFIAGKHSLRKFRVFDQANGESYSSFFLIGGSTQTSVDIDRKIGFYWLSNDQEYIYTTVDMTDVRVVIDSTAHTPFIEFQWKDSGYDDHYVSVQDNIEYGLRYLMIHAKEEDFPQDVNLSDLK